MTEPRYSVVIAAFNAERTIGAAVRSVLAQTTRDLEVIVVDDGSLDETAAVVERLKDRDPRVRLLGQGNRGPAAARNYAIEEARGDYVGFLDADDLWLPEYLELCGAALERCERPGFAYTDAYVFEPASGRVRHQSAMHGERPPDPPPGDRAQLLLELMERNFVYVSALVPRSLLVRVGGFNVRLSGAEDYDLWVRILIAGCDAAWVPGRHALYRVHARQLSRNTLQMRSHTLEMFRGIDPRTLPSEAHRALLERRIERLDRELRVVRGDLRLRHALRLARWRLGRLRERLGLAHTWYEQAPPEVAAAFPDLTKV